MKMYNQWITIFFIFIFSSTIINASSAITYKLAAGRFGDQLLNYYKARWLAFRYLGRDENDKIPFLYKPFIYSDKLMMHTRETRYTSASPKQYVKTIKLKDNMVPNQINPTAHILYESSYYLKFPGWDYYSVNWMNNPDFIKELRELVTPIIPIKKMSLPKDAITVAVHIRRGNGGDPALLAEKNEARQKYLDVGWPDKAPPLSFYIDQIKKLSAMLDNQKMYVYIFTDDKNPKELVNRIRSAIMMSNVKFDCRENNDQLKDTLLEDFFNMTQFDCFIRSNSNFSKCADPLGDYKIIIYLKHARWVNHELIVDDVGIKINQQLFDKWEFHP